MNREILFRGKRIDNEKWVEGYISRPHHRNDGKIEGYYFNALDELGWVAECAVSAETVCQYTGLTDKNGRKIFEGDIVQYLKIGALGKVVWYEGDYIGFAVDDIDDSFQHYDKELFGKVEVIGNIFDNPELLEGGRS